MPIGKGLETQAIAHVRQQLQRPTRGIKVGKPLFVEEQRQHVDFGGPAVRKHNRMRTVSRPIHWRLGRESIQKFPTE